MRINKFYILIVLIACCQACESVIDLGDDGLGEVLIMNAQMSTSDLEHTVWLGRSDRGMISPVEDAVISCYVNGELVSVAHSVKEQFDIPLSWESDVAFGMGGYHIEASFITGDQVHIEAETPDGLRCSSEIVVPRAPVVLDASAVLCETAAEREMGRRRFSVTIRDWSDERNFYFFRLLDQSFIEVDAAHERANFHPGDILTRLDEEVEVNTIGEPLLNSGERTVGSPDTHGNSFFDNKENLFTDALFLNGEYTFRVYTRARFDLKPPSIDKGDCFVAHNRAVVRLFQISKEEYLYLSGYQFIQSLESGTFFTEDFVFPCNVIGGLGFVSINSATDFVIEFPSCRYDWETYL